MRVGPGLGGASPSAGCLCRPYQEQEATTSGGQRSATSTESTEMRPSVAQFILDMAYPEQAEQRRLEQMLVAVSIMAWGMAMKAWIEGRPLPWARMDWKGNAPDDEDGIGQDWRSIAEKEESKT